jgi:dTDP-4-dehydrorhamnose 3,5-epimerase
VIFSETGLKGSFLIEVELQPDARGSFGRTYCSQEFQEHGLESRVLQCSFSYNGRRGTLRGMHYQEAPHEEAKLIRCTRGAMYDVIVDVRPESPTYCEWTSFELTARPGKPSKMVYAPRGFAHGFLTLEDDTEVVYQMSAFYAPEAGRGFRWNDPTFGIVWPEPVRVISDRDRNYPDFVVDRASIQS